MDDVWLTALHRISPQRWKCQGWHNRD